MKTIALLTVIALLLVSPVYAQQRYDGVISFDYPDGWIVTASEGTIHTGNVDTESAFDGVQSGQIVVLITSPSIARGLGTEQDYIPITSDDPVVLSAFYAGYFAGVLQIMGAFTNAPPVLQVYGTETIDAGALTFIDTGTYEVRIITTVKDEPLFFIVVTAAGEYLDWEPDVLAVVASAG